MKKKPQNETTDRPSGLQGSDGDRDDIVVVVPDEHNTPTQGPATENADSSGAAADFEISEVDRQTTTDAAAKVFEDGGEPQGDDQPTEEKKLLSAEAGAMASMLKCAAAMTGLYGDDEDDDTDWTEVAMCLADFFRNEPAAPAAAGLMQLKLKKKVILLPNEDPRRVELVLDLFRLAITRMEEFIAADAKAEIARQATALPTARDRLDGEGPFDRDDDRLTKSDTGKALYSRTV